MIGIFFIKTKYIKKNITYTNCAKHGWLASDMNPMKKYTNLITIHPN